MLIMNWSKLIFLFLICAPGLLSAQYAQWTENELTLDNGVVRRVIQLPAVDGRFLTKSYKPVSGEFHYFPGANPDFQFEIDGVVYSGNSAWSQLDIMRISDNLQGEGAAVVLLSADKKVELTVRFLMYPHLPVIRKNLVFKNLTTSEVALESVDTERFGTINYHPSTFSWIYSDYGRRKSIGPYEGNLQDALVIVHDMNREAGIVIGNEASGVLKRTAVFWDSPDISAGMTHKNARFPFRKWLQPGEAFEAPQVFTMVYNHLKDPEEILSTAVPDYIRRHMGIRLSVLEEKPTFVYNTWNPFQKNINEELIRELAKAAADAGMKEFIIDDGWQDSYGDWGINYEKFPNGLKPVFDYIKSLGMKPGLWVSVGSASSDSKVFHEHPEWFVRGADGKFANLHTDNPNDEVRSACYSTGWKDYIKDVLLRLAVDYGLEYLKLDFAVVSSAYVFNAENSGCYSAAHPGHKDHHESMYVNFERMWEMFDELHEAKPNLFIDCTFETMGGLQMIDYAMLKHAEGNWLSNFAGDEGDKTDLRVRNMAWWRSPAIPATALVIGNPQMQDIGWETHIKSLAGALPIMLGDPRKLSPADLKKYRAYADWLQSMQNKYDFMSFRQDLLGFGEPTEGHWDGFQRINTETRQGGIIGVFRHGALDSERIVSVSYLDPSATYSVLGMDGKQVAELSGNELKTMGFKLKLPAAYSGELFEIAVK